jgi:hypothetical protein
MSKLCRICKEIKPLTAFLFRKDSGVYRTQCERCRSKEKIIANRKKLYRITITQYNQLFETQLGCCKICQKHQAVLNRSLSVDHCHMTGKVRGLLCSHCNFGLGHFKDNISYLQKAAIYLTKSMGPGGMMPEAAGMAGPTTVDQLPPPPPQ